MIRSTLNAVGRVLFGSGVVVLLFTAYQLWGTGILESHSQATLRHKLDQSLPAGVQQLGNQVARQVQAHPIAASTTPANKVAPTIADPPEGSPVGIIQIPNIGLDQVVVEGVGTTDLRMGPGHYPGTPLPGELGNVGIAGHRTTYGHPFYNLNQLQAGDQIVITTKQGVFVYATVSSQVISPSDSSVLDPSKEPVLTLTTCNPRYSASQRLVVKADLVRTTLYGPGGPPAATTPTSTTTTTTTTAPRRSDATAQAGNADLAGGGESHDYLPSILWALGTLAAGLVVWLAARRWRHRWLIYLGGGLGVLVLLFFFFTAVSPLLPASF